MPACLSNSWIVKIGTQGKFSLRVELSIGGATASLSEPPDATSETDEPRLLWSFKASLHPPVNWGVRPTLLFDIDAEVKNVLDNFLTNGLRNLCYREYPSTRIEFLSRKEVIDSLFTIQRHLIASLLPTPTEAARVFPSSSSLRGKTYQWAANDETGRISQMVKICPGIFILGSKLPSRISRSASGELTLFDEFGEILKMITAGKKLSAILDYTVKVWRTYVNRKMTNKQIRNQRIRIARAGPLVLPEDLWEICPNEVIEQDIPSHPIENRIWFDFQQILSERDPLGPWTLDPSQKKRYFGFISRHTIELARLFKVAESVDPSDTIRSELRSFLDYLRVTGRHLGRDSKPERVFEESRNWHRTIHLVKAGKIPPTQTLKFNGLDRFKKWSCGNDVISLLLTVEDLTKESEKMEHCVRTYALNAVTGKLQIFHADISGEPYTVSLSISAREPILQEMSGFRNKRPGEVARQVIGWWIEDLVAVLKGRKGLRPPRLKGRFE